MKVGTDGVLLGAWVDVTGKKRFLDLGTGSGVIALMLAQRTDDDALIDAIDISEKDIRQARFNIEQSMWKTKVIAHHTAIQNFKPDEKYDCIVSNPPYFSKSLEPSDPDRKKAKHTVSLTPAELLISTKHLMKGSGALNLILPLAEGEHFIEIAASVGVFCTRKTAFRTRPGKVIERLLLEFRFSKQQCSLSELLLYKEGDNYSEEYRSLTADFYLNF
jgi:tRNA1Val (adenine37-N6)-methyltransferase